ncbi:hypothetical protein O1611_g2241 [Lasiodiplodia mahajangana]|uniref:Uncharacterized protein n=1 Tax=Lasiodiplodia mahajangana TaxID=1108764 RepID=A0ACC2JVS9_9PEZI|nr:hypothetical protein O1611_g2241 [Lasiodiplodia mahajangana]
MTAASVALLVRDNDKYPDVQYDSIVSSLLPGDFVMPGQGYTEGVSIDDILGHRTGMPRHDESYLGPRAEKTDDGLSITRNLRNLSVSAPIRSTQMYNNMMYTVAAYLVEKKSGLAFADFLQEHFFGPLGMSSSHLHPERAQANGLSDRIAKGHTWNKDRELYTSFEPLNSPEAEGAGSIVTSVNDYIKWVKAIMNREHPIDDEVYKGLTKMRSFSSTDPEDREPMTTPTVYAAGLEIYYYRGYLVIGHDGGVPGFGSRHFFVPEFKLGATIFGNSGDATNVATIIARELVDEVLGVPESERPDWEKLVYDAVAKWENSPEQEKMRRVLREEAEPQKMPLSTYTGEYWNPGYHGVAVTIKDNKLFIDATERSMGFTLLLDHVRNQTEYIAHYSGYQSDDDELLEAEFRFENDKVVKMGLDLVGGDELIWFDRVEEA